MKKVLTAVFLALVPIGVQAMSAPSGDTIPSRNDKYYYNVWYDTCPIYTWGHDAWLYFRDLTSNKTGTIGARFETPVPLAVKGLAVLEGGRPKDYFLYTARSHLRLDTLRETLLLYQVDSSAPGGVVLLDSMAWRFEDSIPVRLPRHEGLTDTSDLDNFMLANAYEVYFKRPVVVDSSFIVAGTLRNNGVIRPIIEWLENIPIRYPVIWEIAHCDTCPPNDLYLVYSDDTAGNIGPDGFHYLEEHPLIGYFHCGPFFAIVDTASYSITVLSDDTLQGSVSGGGVFRAGESTVISATPAEGYLFAFWSDFDLSNPRTIQVFSDSTLTAYFFPDDTTAIVQSDSLLHIALYPNPAHSRVEVRVAQSDRYSVVVYDVNGRVVYQSDFTGTKFHFDVSDFSAGTYRVVVANRGTTSVVSFIKK